MKVCYVDDSGATGNDPCMVMVGIVVDATRLNRTREEFADIFATVQELFHENLRELKGSKMIFGRNRWRKVDPEVRKKVADSLCNWVGERKHSLVCSVVDHKKHSAVDKAGLPAACNDPWLAGALHIALQVQKLHQGQGKNKGHTFLIFDENKKAADALAELLWSPPEWTDSYYDKQTRQERFDQIIDSTFAIKSHHAGLVQIADLYAFIIRRYCELVEYGMKPEWGGETELIKGYIATLGTRLCARAIRHPARTESECAKWFNAIAPNSIPGLAK